jgi:hypothetical protein
MKRLIDDMSAKQIYHNYHTMKGPYNTLWTCLDKLCAPIIEWHKPLDPDDDQLVSRISQICRQEIDRIWSLDASEKEVPIPIDEMSDEVTRAVDHILSLKARRNEMAVPIGMMSNDELQDAIIQTNAMVKSQPDRDLTHHLSRLLDIQHERAVCAAENVPVAGMSDD